MKKCSNLDNAEADQVTVSSNALLKEPHLWRISMIGATPKSLHLNGKPVNAPHAAFSPPR